MIILKIIFISIYDEFFIKSDNPEAKQYLETTTEIANLKYKIARSLEVSSEITDRYDELMGSSRYKASDLFLNNLNVGKSNLP